VPHPLLWAGLWAAHVEITESVIPNRLNYCVIFVTYTQFTDAVASRGLKTHDYSK